MLASSYPVSIIHAPLLSQALPNGWTVSIRLNGGGASLYLMTGNDLKSAIESSHEIVSTPIITDLLYQNSVFMLTGEAGKGKSVIATNLAICLTSGSPMFGSLSIPKPQRVYYLQLEGYAPDYFRRMFFMASAIDTKECKQTMAQFTADESYEFADSMLTQREKKNAQAS